MNEIKDAEKTIEMKDAGSKLVKGATILAVAGIIAKIFGALFRIPLTNLIGAEGMSYYGVAYPVYSFFLILATAGLPVAISRMVSKRIAQGDYLNAHRTYKLSMRVMIIIGVISFAICFFGAGIISERMGNPGATMSLRAIAPALLIAPVVSAYRGYFQGQQNMYPTAISEVSEQIARVCVGLLLSFALVKNSLEAASAGATFGASAGLVISLLVLSFIYLRGRDKRSRLIEGCEAEEESKDLILKELRDIALPITIGATIMPLMMIIDSMMIMNRLQATGWSYTMSKTLYGLISGFCDPITGLPNVFIDAVAISMLPAITEAFTLRKTEELNKNIQTGIKTMMVIAYPCAMGLLVLARPILYLLYPERLDEASMAVSNLQILTFTILTMSTMRVFSSALQGIGKVVLPVKNLFFGMLVKIGLSYVLVGIPALNINGAAIASVFAYLLPAILNYRGLKKYADVRIDLVGSFAKPLLASGIMAAATWLLYKLLNARMGYSAFAVLLSILFAVILYFVLIFVTGTIRREDTALLPKGELIARVAEKLHLMK